MTKLNPIYKKDVVTNFYVQVGTVDECGFIDFDIYVSKEVKEPNLYYPEFYVEYEVKETVPETDYTYTISIKKKSFIPKNLPQQLISLVDSTFLKPEEYYVTGYVTKEGKAVYYDQFMNKK